LGIDLIAVLSIVRFKGALQRLLVANLILIPIHYSLFSPCALPKKISIPAEHSQHQPESFQRSFVFVFIACDGLHLDVLHSCFAISIVLMIFIGDVLKVLGLCRIMRVAIIVMIANKVPDKPNESAIISLVVTSSVSLHFL
jgi:hypothetical protein